MNDQDIKLLEELMIAFTGDDERFAITTSPSGFLLKTLRGSSAPTMLIWRCSA